MKLMVLESRRLRCARRMKMGMLRNLAHLVLQGGLTRPAKQRSRRTTPYTSNTVRGVHTVEPDEAYLCNTDIARMWTNRTWVSRGR